MIRDIALGKTARRVKQGPRRLARVRGGKGAANSTLVTLSAAFGFGVTHQVRPDNPALGIRKFPGKKMQRFLSPAELARLGQVLAAATSLGVESPFALAAIRLLMLTGCRKNEILTLKRSQIDRYHRCLRLPDSKTGAKIVHLGAAAMRVIETIPEIAGNPYLLPARRMVPTSLTCSRSGNGSGARQIFRTSVSTTCGTASRRSALRPATAC
jgi:integrase